MYLILVKIGCVLRAGQARNDHLVCVWRVLCVDVCLDWELPPAVDLRKIDQKTHYLLISDPNILRLSECFVCPLTTKAFDIILF
tara:strand:+ start:192 stop:443 length:252 start_codon:yes stop_codon:yes gene_type:complete